jgi:hypothetical protein
LRTHMDPINSKNTKNTHRVIKTDI